MDDGGPGLRARKRRRTRRALEDAALRLFSDAGFEATTVEQVAAEADVSPRTFFHYFASKEDAVLGDYDARLQRLAEGVAHRPPDESPSTAVRAALLEIAEDYTDERERLLLRARLTRENPSILGRSLALQMRWEDVIAGAISDRLGVDVDADPRPRLVAATTLSAMRIAQRRWLADEGRSSLPSLLIENLDLLEGGLRNIEAGGSQDEAPDGRTPPSPRPQGGVSAPGVQGGLPAARPDHATHTADGQE